jgi:hypothetical protein
MMTCLKSKQRLLISQEELLVEQQLLVDLPELVEDVQPLAERLDVLQRQPVLVQLLVDAVHVRGQALVLNRQWITCFLMRMLCAWTATSDSSSVLLHSRRL